MATIKLEKIIIGETTTYKKNGSNLGSTAPTLASLGLTNYRLKTIKTIKKNVTGIAGRVTETKSINYSANGTGTPGSATYSSGSPTSTQWNAGTTTKIVEEYENDYLLKAKIPVGMLDLTTEIIKSDADYYHGNDSTIELSGLFFNGGFAYTVPRKPTSYSWVHNGAISWSTNQQKRGALSIWFKPSEIPSDHKIYNGGRMYLLSRRIATNLANWQLSFDFSNGLHFYQYTTGSGISSINQYFGGNIQVDKWHHVVLSHNRANNSNTSTIYMYLNGKQIGTKSTKKIVDQPTYYMAIGTRVTTMRSSSTQFNTGYAASDSRFYGYMKDYWFADYTIPSAAQVATMYNNGDFKKPPFAGYNPYSAHWPLTANNNGYIGGSTNRFTSRFINPDGKTHALGNGNLQAVAQIKYTAGVTPI